MVKIASEYIEIHQIKGEMRKKKMKEMFEKAKGYAKRTSVYATNKYETFKRGYNKVDDGIRRFQASAKKTNASFGNLNLGLGQVGPKIKKSKPSKDLGFRFDL